MGIIELLINITFLTKFIFYSKNHIYDRQLTFLKKSIFVDYFSDLFH